MRISDKCAKCLYDRQVSKTDNEEYLAEIRELLEKRGDSDTSPYMVYLFNKLHEKYFGKGADYKELKKKYNDLVLEMEDDLRAEIGKAEDPLAKALVISRIGNYIDFGAMDNVDQNEFMALFKDTGIQGRDIPVYESLLKQCEDGASFLLICDNCGEIVLDKLFIEQLKKKFPHLKVQALVRGKEVLNDATKEDACYVGIDKAAEVISNGDAVAGTIYDMLPQNAKMALDEADVILAKGQGNYESMSGQGRHVFYAFLCKCDLFTTRFKVPKLTGMLVEENE
ncbi:MAG: ARMT1-like domain-containing protein [Lachnospiraceae bacterium]|nr:ARMT1-like domain-containing protein [Lachnospiraceae bacterium]